MHRDLILRKNINTNKEKTKCEKFDNLTVPPRYIITSQMTESYPIAGYLIQFWDFARFFNNFSIFECLIGIILYDSGYHEQSEVSSDVWNGPEMKSNFLSV